MTSNAVQIGRTMIVFQTKNTEEKEIEVGEQVRAKAELVKKENEKMREEHRQKRNQARKDFEEKRRLKQKINESEEVKKLGLDKFNFGDYLDHMGNNKDLQSALLEQQEMDHQKLIEF